MKLPPKKSFIAILAAALTSAQLSSAATTIVAENFGGTGADLNGTTAETFATGITTAGGSSTWVADAVFNDDGSLVGGNNQSGHLNMGTYINDSKGTATGKFTLSVTINSVPLNRWAGFGFFVANAPATNDTFTNAGAFGSATIIYRETGELDGFAGPGTTTPVDGPDGQTGAQLLTIVLDLTTHDNITDFGTVSFYQGDATGTLMGNHSYASDISFGSVGLSTAGTNVSTSYSGFELTQVPEPSVALLGSLGVLCLLRRRR